MLLNCGAGEDSRIPWTAGRSNQSILKGINPEYLLEGLMLKLKLQYFGYLTWRGSSLEKTLMMGKIEGRRRRGWQRMRWLDGITDSMEWAQGVGDGQWSLACCSPWGHRVGHIWATKLNWNSLMNNQKWYLVSFCSWVIGTGDSSQFTLWQ